MQPLPSSYTTTRRAAHALAEHVLCAVRYAAEGRVGLEPAADGIVTPVFGGRVVGLRGVELADGTRRAPVSTLRAAAEYFAVDPGAPPLWEPSTPCDLDAPLAIAAEGVRALAQWFSLGRAALALVEPDAVPTLWPEHFDLAITTTAGDIFGASPGDATHPGPYLYVVPAAGPVPDGDAGFWAEPFGAGLSSEHVDSVTDAVRFFNAAARRLADTSTEVRS